ncbi:hypothetical protein LEN26_006164 [Aphanomyces euteiches]|nr:hypothetical protein AeMF1_013073 [Aphanomyces euteiches]KAH9136431.1 hypothetical protein LEN26_006164 [Aphanomyces euteiches]KAH9196049.1 hypothetical protein AeNC1_001985 [Aphanomyces euteiches]
MKKLTTIQNKDRMSVNLAEPFLLVTDAATAPSPSSQSTERFAVCMGIGLLLVFGSFLLIPMSMAAFGTVYSIGSLVVVGSTLFVASMKQQLENLKEKNRGSCFAIYLVTIALTLFFALYPGLWLRSLLVFLSVFVQCCALAWYCLSYFPRIQAAIRAAGSYICMAK